MFSDGDNDDLKETADALMVDWDKAEEAATLVTTIAVETLPVPCWKS